MTATATTTAPTIVPFAAEHLAGAGLLLAERHRAQRRVEPGLDPTYEDPAAAMAEIDALTRVDGATGVAALVNGSIDGFLLGTPRDASWGPNVWVEPAGHAVADAELVRDLYADAAARWVAAGLTSHYAIVPGTDPALVDAWFRLGFGHQQVHAIREPWPAGEEPAMPPGLRLRAPTRDDIDAMARVDLSLPRHQALAPVFSPRPVPSFAEALAELEADLGDERLATFVVERDDAVVGVAQGCAIELSSMHTSLALPRGAGFLGFASVLPEHRGFGVGRVLGEAVLAWSRDAGHPCVVTDWRMTNLLSSRAWPRLGFRPSFYRLHRAIA